MQGRRTHRNYLQTTLNCHEINVKFNIVVALLFVSIMMLNQHTVGPSTLLEGQQPHCLNSYEGQVWIAQKKDSNTKSLIRKNAVILGSQKKEFRSVWIALSECLRLSEWRCLNRPPRATRWELRAGIHTKWKLMMRLLPWLPCYRQNSDPSTLKILSEYLWPQIFSK